MKYAEQRIPTLNEYCVVCDEQHVFQNGSMLKVRRQGPDGHGLLPRVAVPGLSPRLLSLPQPAVCTRELCVFSFYTLGVMSGAAEEVATGAEVGSRAKGDRAVALGCCPFTPRSVPKVVDLLVAMCRAALESPRKSIIFEPYPSVVDPNDPKTLAFNPKVSAGGAMGLGGARRAPPMATSLLPHPQKKNYERLQKALDSVMSIREMTQVYRRGPAPPMAPCEAPPSPWRRILHRGWHFGADTRLLTAGWVPGDPRTPLSPLPGVLPGDQEADGQAGPSGPPPPAVVRPRVLRPRPAAPRPSPLPRVPRDRGWGGGQLSIPGTTPSAPFSWGVAAIHQPREGFWHGSQLSPAPMGP